MDPDYYELLGLAATRPDTRDQRRLRALADSTTPTDPRSEGRESKFKEINVAYEDVEGSRAGPAPSSLRPSSARTARFRVAAGSRPGGEESASGDIFDAFFGGRTRSAPSSRGPAGARARSRAVVHLAPRRPAFGATATVEIRSARRVREKCEGRL